MESKILTEKSSCCLLPPPRRFCFRLHLSIRLSFIRTLQKLQDDLQWNLVEGCGMSHVTFHFDAHPHQEVDLLFHFLYNFETGQVGEHTHRFIRRIHGCWWKNSDISRALIFMNVCNLAQIRADQSYNILLFTILKTVKRMFQIIIKSF